MARAGGIALSVRMRPAMGSSGEKQLLQPVLDRGQVSDYIADITSGLVTLARAQELPVLVYLLEMTAAEARGQVEAEKQRSSFVRG